MSIERRQGGNKLKMQRDKIAHPNSDSARTPDFQNESMSPPVPSQDSLNAIDCSANEDNSDEFIFANSTLLSMISKRFYLIFTETTK